MQRTFIIGDYWIYYKIYCGPKTADFILTNVIKPTTELLIQKGLIEKWFFIRYGDPDNHIRLRLYISDSKEIGKVINQIFISTQHHIKTGHINKMQLDTYKRELERYGENTMEFSELLFWHESKMIVEFLDLIEGEEGEKVRWLFGLRAIDQLLIDFKINIEDRLIILQEIATGFEKEFNANSSLVNQLSDKYRKEKNDIFSFMDRNSDTNSPFVDVFQLLLEKSQDSTKVVSKINKVKLDNKQIVNFDAIIKSYIHMLMNRLFRSNQRIHEMVIYGFLVRYYKTILARQKYN
jgi:thiopeptide-type bacteriocin biosynthesis protein